jgi:hypothetical protein
MDLIRVNANVDNATNLFTPYGALIEDYDSLVWTEKFQDHSEFVLTTKHVDDFLVQLPLESFVTLLQSQEVMKVESRLLERDAQGQEKLTIRGSSVTSILQHRVIQLGSPSKTAKLDLSNADQVLAFLVIYSTIKSYVASGEFSGAFDPNAISAGFVVTSNTALSATGAAHTYWIPAGVVDQPIRTYLEESGLGIAFRRPDGKSGYVLDASPISSTLTPSITQARLDLRRPNDLSDDSAPGSVIFDADSGHFVNISWLESVKNAKTIGYLNVPNTTNMTTSTFNPAFPSASLRTKLGLLGYSHESSPPGDEAEGTAVEIEAALAAQMTEKMILDHPYKVITGGEVSGSAPYRYLEHYELGDIVGVYSVRYGLQKMRVTEFIRSWEDGTEKAYPTLSQIY